MEMFAAEKRSGLIDVSVIIVNYNTYDLTKNSILSIFEKTKDILYEIIVVDNASPDGRGKDLELFFGNKIIYVQSRKNLGFGRANNLGATYASGRNLFLLNPDTFLLNNAIKILSDYLDNNPNVGICGGNLFDEDRNPSHSFKTRFPGIIWEVKMIFGDIPRKISGQHPDFNYSNKPKSVAYITGADLMMRHNVFNKVKGFDPDFFMYFEETELSYRVKKMGLDVVSVPLAEIVHLEKKKTDISGAKVRQMNRGRDLYYRKTTNQFMRLIINILHQAHLPFKIFLFSLLGNKNRVLRYRFLLKEKRNCEKY